MKSLLLAAAAATLATAVPAAAQTATRYESRSQDEEARFEEAQRRFDAEYRTFQDALERYKRHQASQVDARYDGDDRIGDGRYDGRYDGPGYDPARDYRSGNYQERVLESDERVYRGDDGRYYCRRNDGTTGLIVGAAAGGLFGNVIAGRRSSTVGTLLGAIAGGALGSQVQRNQQQVRCR